MLDIMLQVLAVLGIILLILLAVLLTFVLLVLFFPVTYRFYGKKDEGGIRCAAKAKWLFGLLRVRYSYPEGRHLTVKAVCFTLFDAAIPGGAAPEAEPEDHGTEEKKAHDTISADAAAAESAENDDKGASDKQTDGKRASRTEKDGRSSDGTETNNNTIFLKFHKLKYTICRIYDKIKKIWENISYYMELLKEEETKLLFRYVLFRIGKVLKHIRPRRIKVNIVFGTGSPDTTGYFYGAYCMVSAFQGMNIWVVPDFEQAVLQGEADAAGHIAIWVLVWNGCKLFFDKEIRKFLKKIKV